MANVCSRANPRSASTPIIRRMSSEAKNLEAISKAIDKHNAECEFPASEVRMNPFEVERLGWDQIRGLPLIGDPAIATGRFRIVCSRRRTTGDESRRSRPSASRSRSEPRRSGVGDTRSEAEPGGEAGSAVVEAFVYRFRPRSFVTSSAQRFRSVKPPLRIRTPIAIRIAPPPATISAVVALDRGERGRRPREGQRRQQERDPEPERVDRQEEGAVERLALVPARVSTPPSAGPGARRPGDREGGAGDDRSAAAGALEQRLDPPLAVQAVHEHRPDEEDAHHDQEDGADVRQEVLVARAARCRAPSRSAPGG